LISELLFVEGYILPVIEIKLLGRFHPDSLKTERLVCVDRFF